MGVIFEVSGKPRQRSLRDETGHSLQETNSDPYLKGPHNPGCIERMKEKSWKKTAAETHTEKQKEARHWGGIVKSNLDAV